MIRLFASLGFWFIVFCLILILINTTLGSIESEEKIQKKDDYVLVVPSPSAILLGGIGTLTVSLLKRRKTLQ